MPRGFSQTLAEVEELLLDLEKPTHTAVLVDVMTGLRVSELLALKWRDIDYPDGASASPETTTLLIRQENAGIFFSFSLQGRGKG